VVVALSVAFVVWRRWFASNTLESDWRVLCNVTERVQAYLRGAERNDRSSCALLLSLCGATKPVPAPRNSIDDRSALLKLCWDYVFALAAVYRHFLLPRNEEACRLLNVQLTAHNRVGRELFQRLIEALREDPMFPRLADVVEWYDVFFAHAGELKQGYVLGPLNGEAARHRWRAFTDSNDIRPSDLSILNRVMVGLLSSRVVLLIVCHHFVSKEWTLFELFFAMARMELDGKSRQFSIAVDLINKHNHGADEWLRFVDEGLGLPWPTQCGGMPPVTKNGDAKFGDHAVTVIEALLPMVNHCKQATAAAADSLMD